MLAVLITACSDWGKVGTAVKESNRQSREAERLANRIQSLNGNVVFITHKSGLECAVLYQDGLSCNWDKFNKEQSEK